ncbi:MAG TPA: DUF892 family protein [Gaiellaceae bacterium]|nr:DUF892 family protein [Gaiellaceae bacterium]
MAEPLTDPRTLLGARLRTMLWIELTLADEVLPRLLDGARSTVLRHGLERHLLETREHVETVRHALAGLQTHMEPEESAALKGLVTEHEQLVKRVDDGDHALLDLVHAQSAAATEHLELAAYQALANLAEALGEEELGMTLRDLKEQEQHALELAERAMTSLLAEHVSSA